MYSDILFTAHKEQKNKKKITSVQCFHKFGTKFMGTAVQLESWLKLINFFFIYLKKSAILPY